MIELTNLNKTYNTRQGGVHALRDVSLRIGKGQFVAITGPSGCGKTTLMMTIGGMQRPDSGKVVFGDVDLYAMDAAARATFRAERIGFVFQMFHLVPYLTVLENIRLAASPQCGNDIMQLLDRLGLADRADHKPSQLSVGQRQRAAIARAMINKPGVILADEPTGNLDPENEQHVFNILSDFHRSGGTVIVITHGNAAEQFADRAVRMADGRIIGDETVHAQRQTPDQPNHSAVHSAAV